jgi:hypothetical protein
MSVAIRGVVISARIISFLPDSEAAYSILTDPCSSATGPIALPDQHARCGERVFHPRVTVPTG